MGMALELIPGLVFGFDLFFPDEDNNFRGFCIHLFIFRLMVLWGFDE